MSSQIVYVPDKNFVQLVLPEIEAIVRLVPELLPQTLACQFAVETGWGETLAQNPYNLAGISSRGRVLQFPSSAAFVHMYANTIRLPYYRAVLEASTVEAQLQALGESPWSAAHYAAPGEPAGSTLLAVWRDNIQPLGPAIFAAAEGVDQAAQPETGAVHNPAPTPTEHAASPVPSTEAEGGTSALVQDVLGGGITPDAQAPTSAAEAADTALYQELRIVPTVIQVGDSHTEAQCLYAGVAALRKAGASADQIAWYLEQCYGFNPVIAVAFADSIVQSDSIFGFPLPAVPKSGWDFAAGTPDVAVPGADR
jgi:hypothetical protein